jgi:hypothetical protein
MDTKHDPNRQSIMTIGTASVGIRTKYLRIVVCTAASDEDAKKYTYCLDKFLLVELGIYR